MPRRPPSTKIPLGMGSITHRDERRARARVEYLDTIRGIAPQVLRELRDEVFPAITAGDVSATEAKLLAWAARWHMTARWVITAASRTLAAWSLAPALLDTDPPTWSFHGDAWSYYLPPDPPDLVPNLGPRWHRLRETREAAYDRLLRAAKAAITQALDEDAGQAMGDEFEVTAAVRPEAVEWLVRRVVLGQGPKEIARDPRAKSVEAVRKATTRLARELDLPLPDLD